MWTREQPVEDALVLRSYAPSEAIIAAIQPLDIEFLPRFDPIDLPEFRGQYDLSLGRDGGLHIE